MARNAPKTGVNGDVGGYGGFGVQHRCKTPEIACFWANRLHFDVSAQLLPPFCTNCAFLGDGRFAISIP